MLAKTSCMLLFITLICLCTYFHTAASSGSVDTLRYSQSLSGNKTLISGNGTFVFGFFQPGNSSEYYLGIWFNNLPKNQFTVVWIANREKPLSDPETFEFKISNDGNLALLASESKTLIWSSNVSSISRPNATAVVLRENGNLILINDDGSVIWQSFDHPTHAVLPGSKFGMNKLTKQVQQLTSWKTSDDPSPGPFSLSIDHNGTSQFIVQWQLSKAYWNTGLWTGHSFSSIPEMMPGGLPAYPGMKFAYVDNANESYFTYSTGGINLMLETLLQSSGDFLELMLVPNSGSNWIPFYKAPKFQCYVYGRCGPFGICNEGASPPCSCIRSFSPASPKYWTLGDQSFGCKRNSALQCDPNTTAFTDKFYEMQGMRLPDINRHTLTLANVNECKSACLNNCSCNAYSYTTGCLLWYGDLYNLQQFNDGTGSTIYIRVSAYDLPSYSEHKKAKATRLVIVVISAALLIFLTIVCIRIIRRREIRRGLISKSKVENLVLYSYTELKQVTKNFSEKLGKGGFGSVFKGELMLQGSAPISIAVKKLEGVHQGDKQFRAEVSTIGTIQHVNLVRLRGFCSEGHRRLLVYEYVSNGSLDHQLFNNKNAVMDWNTRYKIALGTARGLAYLHEECRDRIIHCDIKPENILLDSSFNPKVADFGLAKLIGRDFSRVLTTLRGTIGYLAPEWISGMAITAKADVYSYGLTLFEIISGKRNSKCEANNSSFYYPLYAARKLSVGDVLPVLDKRLEGEADMEEVARACLVACWCIQDNESDRPTMGQVVQILEKVLDVEMPPIPRTLQLMISAESKSDDASW